MASAQAVAAGRNLDHHDGRNLSDTTCNDGMTALEAEWTSLLPCTQNTSMPIYSTARLPCCACVQVARQERDSYRQARLAETIDFIDCESCTHA